MAMSKEDILKEISTVPWYHSFEIVPGVFTPGKLRTEPKVTFAHFGLPTDLSGKSVLEIGTWDGPVAFECEARGAVVTALDIQDPSKTGFNVAKKILDSKITYVQGSVYDATRLLAARYDYVFFLGVYYHLKHPILAFEQISEVLVDDGSLVFEGACLQEYARMHMGVLFPPNSLARLGIATFRYVPFTRTLLLETTRTGLFRTSRACQAGWKLRGCESSGTRCMSSGQTLEYSGQAEWRRRWQACGSSIGSSNNRA